MKLVIIAGHGGKDPGACNGIHREADFNLKIAAALEKNIKALTGDIAIYRNRLTDTKVSVYDNAAQCKRIQPKLSISCHCNAAENKTANGQECIYWPGDMSGQNLAAAICAVNAGLIFNRGEKADPAAPGFVEIKDTGNCTSLIWEVAFISNTDDLKKLLDPAWLDNVAKNTAAQIIKFYGARVKTQTYDVANELKYLCAHAITLYNSKKITEMKQFINIKANDICSHL